MTTTISGTGITLTASLKQEHASDVQVAGSASTPGMPNHYYRRIEGASQLNWIHHLADERSCSAE